MLRILLITLLISVFAFSVAEVVAADNKKQISSQQAAKAVKQRYGGTVLKVQKQKNDNAYKVKIVKPNGQVISKKVNAKTGNIEK